MLENLNGFVFSRHPKHQSNTPQYVDESRLMELNGFVFKISEKKTKNEEYKKRMPVNQKTTVNKKKLDTEKNIQNQKNKAQEIQNIYNEKKKMKIADDNKKDYTNPSLLETMNTNFKENNNIALPENKKAKVTFNCVEPKNNSIFRVPTPYRVPSSFATKPLSIDPHLSLKEPTAIIFEKEKFDIPTAPLQLVIPDHFSLEEKIRHILLELISDTFISIELTEIIRNYKYEDPYEILIRDYKNLIEEYRNDCVEHEEELSKWENIRDETLKDNTLVIPENEVQVLDCNLKEEMESFDSEILKVYESLEMRRDYLKKEFVSMKRDVEKLIGSVFECMKKENALDPILLLKAMSKM